MGNPEEGNNDTRAIDEFLGRKYKLVTSSDSFEEYLKYIGVGVLSRKTAILLSPVAILTKNDDGSYTFTFDAVFRSVKITFRLGEEFIEERADGVKVKSKMTLEGDDLVQIQVESNGRTSKHVRKFTKDKLTAITTAEGWDGKCVRVYEYIE